MRTPSETDLEFRRLVAKAIKRCLHHKRREDIAKELEFLVKEPVSKYDLDEFTRPTRGKMFPGAWVKALCQVTGDHELERYALCEQCKGIFAAGEGMARLLKINSKRKA